MAYNRPRNPQPPQEPPASQNTGPGLRDAVDTVTAPFAGLWQGLSGKNKTYEQWMRDKKRKRQGFPAPNPNWLQRLIRGK